MGFDVRFRAATALGAISTIPALAFAAWPHTGWFLVGAPILAVVLFRQPFFFYTAIVALQFQSLGLFFAIGDQTPLSFNLYEAVLLLSCVAWFFNRSIGLIPPYRGTPIDFWLIAFTLFISISLLWSEDPIRGIWELKRFLIFLFFSFPVVLTILTSKGRVEAFVTLMILCGLINTAVVFFSQFFSYPDFASFNIFEEKAGWTLMFLFNEDQTGNRGHAFGHPLFTAVWLNVSILMCLLRFLISTTRGKRLMYACLGLLTLAGHISTMSKGPLLGLLAGVAFIVWYLPQMRRRMLTVAISLVMMLILAVLISSGPELGKRLAVTSYQVAGADEASSAGSRLIWWDQALQAARASDFLGTGVGGVLQYLENKPPDPHNIYIAAFSELGIGGLVLFLVLIVRALSIYFISTRWLAPSSRLTYSTVMMGACISSLVYGLTMLSYSFSFHWLLLGIYFAVDRIWAADEKVAGCAGSRMRSSPGTGYLTMLYRKGA